MLKRSIRVAIRSRGLFAGRLLRAVAATLFCGLVAAPDVARAQVTTGDIAGTVKDESDAVLPGAIATIESPALPSGPASETTDEKGEFRFSRLSPGLYVLKVTLDGFSPDQTNVRVEVGGRFDANVVLKVGTVAENLRSSVRRRTSIRRSGSVDEHSERAVQADANAA